MAAILGCLGGCGAGDSAPSSDSAEAVVKAAEKPIWFDDVTQPSRLDFRHQAGDAGKYFMPQTVGSGAALFDYNNDGVLDLFLIQNAGSQSNATNRLFRQSTDGIFEDVTSGSGLDVASYGMGVAAGDVNNDGWTDLVITEYRGVRLFLNREGKKFDDVSVAAGVQSLHWGTSAAFVDYDRDGWLDLVVVNYVTYDPARWCGDADGEREYCGPNAFKGAVTNMFRNLGSSSEPNQPVRFADVTLDCGLGRVPGPGLGVFCADFDGDRWPDIFVANDGQPNHLWINQRDGTFQEQALERGIALNRMGQPEANMGIGVGDIDGNGHFDLLITHLTEETLTLWAQEPRGLFQDRTSTTELLRPRWRGTGFGTVLADFDHDGALDLAVVNGRVRRAKHGEELAIDAALKSSDTPPFWDRYVERNQLFSGDGAGRFRDVSLENAPFCGTPRVGRGLACGDLNNDGALDLVVTSIDSAARIFRNVCPQRGHWLIVRAIDPALHRDAYGAEVTVRAGNRSWMRWINPGYSYLCSNDPRAHFGLGTFDHVDQLTIIWADGAEETFAGLAADQIVTLSKGEGQRIGAPAP